MAGVHGFANISNEGARFADLDRLVETLTGRADELLGFFIYPTDGVSRIHVAVVAFISRQDQNDS